MLINMLIILFSNIILGTMITISSSSWMMAWLGLELNMLSFLPFMKMKNNLYSIEASMKYFLIQAISSSMFILIIMNFSFLNSLTFYPFMIMNLMLFMKMALVPLHFWLPNMANSLSWMTLLMILTWQKIAPLAILWNSPFNMLPFVIMNLLLGSFMMINQTSMKKLLVFSSMTHLGWILVILSTNFMNSILYFSLYSLNSIVLIFMLQMLKIFNMTQLMNLQKLFFISISLNLLSMMGFPPFLMFFPKLLIILNTLYLNMLLTLIMILASLIAMFAYLQMMWSYLLYPVNFSKLYYKFNPSYKHFSFLIFPLMFLSPLMLLM